MPAIFTAFSKLKLYPDVWLAKLTGSTALVAGWPPPNSSVQLLGGHFGVGSRDRSESQRGADKP